MSRPVSILIVEDSEDDAELVARELRRRGFQPDLTRVESGPALRSALMARDWDVVISDHKMPGFSGDEALGLVKRFDPDLPFIVVSGTRGEEHAVDAMRAGASDFIVKSRLHRLAPVVERELLASSLRGEQRKIAAALEESQRQLRESQELEAVGRLAGGVAHDFNNLVGAILSYADLILHSLPMGDKHREDVEEIKRAGRHAAELTRQLVAFSRQQVMHKSVLNLNEVIHDELGLLQRMAGPKVEIDLRLEPRVWLTKGDRIADRAGPDEPHDQRAGCHAQRRHADVENEQRQLVGRHRKRRDRRRPVITSVWRRATPASAFLRRFSPRSSTPSSRPRNWARARAWAWPPSRVSCGRAAATSTSTVKPARARR